MLAYAAYVDLNPIRAAMTERLETSQFTGVKDRIDDLRERSDRSRMSGGFGAVYSRSVPRFHEVCVEPISLRCAGRCIRTHEMRHYPDTFSAS